MLQSSLCAECYKRMRLIKKWLQVKVSLNKVLQSNPSQLKEQHISQVVAELRAELSCSSVSESEQMLQPCLAFRRWILNECLEIVFLSVSLSLLPFFSHCLPRLSTFPRHSPTRGSYEPSTPLVKFPWWQVICPSTSSLRMWHWVACREHMNKRST